MSTVVSKPAWPGGKTVIRISIAYFHELGAALKPLETLSAEMHVVETLGPIYGAINQVDHLLAAEWFFPAIKSSFTPAQNLRRVLNDITIRTDLDQPLGYLAALNIENALQGFLGSIRAELAVADAYFVTRKGGYDTSALIWSPEVLFPSDLGPKVPLAIPDIRDAARALAYDIPTAAGFHVLRAVEAVLREYWIAVTSGAAQPIERNLGVYLRELENKKAGSEKVRSVLKQIKDLHRNPLMHPEDRLDLDSAVDLFGIARSAIGAMLREIPSPPSPAMLTPSLPTG